MANKTLTQTVTFGITGEFITDTARNLVTDGEWEQGLRLLVESLDGATYDIAVAVLTGDSKFIGDSRDGDGIELVEDTESSDYKQSVIDVYSKITKIGGGFYEADRYITSFGPEDARGVTDSWSNRYSDGKLNVGEESLADFRLRAQSYCYPNEKIERVFIDETPYYGILTPSPKHPPLWLDGNTIKQAFDHAFRTGWLHEDGYDERYGTSETDVPESFKNWDGDNWDDDNWRTDKLKEFRDKILLKSGDRFINLVVGDQTYKVPEIPFLHWCDNSKELRDKHLPEWEPVCPSGLKMSCDNQYHTDWVVGAGLDPDVSYEDDFKDAAYSLMFEKQKELFKFEINVLSGSGTVTSEVLHPDELQDVQPGNIIIIPNAGVEYQLAAQVACSPNEFGSKGAVITEIGGPVAHLVKVSRELELNLIRIENAQEQIPRGTLATINLDCGNIQLSTIK